MTSQQLQHLSTILIETDFLQELRDHRPELDSNNYLKAAGWEDCIKFIEAMPARPQPEVEKHDNYVEVEKL